MMVSLTSSIMVIMFTDQRCDGQIDPVKIYQKDMDDNLHFGESVAPEYSYVLTKLMIKCWNYFVNGEQGTQLLIKNLL